MYRSTYIEINNKNLLENVKEIKKEYNNYKYYIGVVKANAYGHGYEIIKDLVKGGINYFATSSLEESLEVRKKDKSVGVLCLEPINIKYLDVVLSSNITLTIDSIDSAKSLVDANPKEKVNIHLKLDTGMNRLGFNNKEELNEAISILKQNKNIYIEGIFTHLATSGISDIYYDKQINKFKELTKDIDLSKIPIVHINRSITLVHHEKLPFETGVRLGIIMYGFSQSIKEPTGFRKLKRDIMLKVKNISPVKLTNNLSLKTAYTLYTEVISIKQIKKGTTIGYGTKHIAKEDCKIAILSIGYADGMTSNLKYVSINNKKYPILGDVCMDMTIIKIDDTVKLHDKVEIFGDKISIREASRNANTNAYHLLTGITSRVPRIYKNNNNL